MRLREIAMLAGVALMSSLPVGAAAANVASVPWGTTAKGEDVRLYTLKGRGGMEVKISSFGARITELWVPDAKGDKRDVVLGYPDLQAYEKAGPTGILGALIGPYTSRLGITFKVAGKTYTQTQTPQPGRNSIGHSGEIGFHKRVWTAAVHDGVEPRLVMTIKDPDGLGGYPGNVTVTVTYAVRRDNTLVQTIRGVTDRPTVMNITNHSYWALGGEGSGEVINQIMTVYSSQYLPDYTNTPVASVAKVEGSFYDFTTPTRLGDRLALPEVERGYNVNMLIDGPPGKLRPAVRLEDPDSGIVMLVNTTQPALLLYSDNEGPFNGKNGHVYRPHNAMVFETQHLPDSPNHPEFRSTEVTPENPLHEVTEFKFSVKKPGSTTNK